VVEGTWDELSRDGIGFGRWLMGMEGTSVVSWWFELISAYY